MSPRTVEAIELDFPATDENFSEAGYLRANPDVARAVATGLVGSGREHFDTFGCREGRSLRLSERLRDAQAAKLAALEPLIRTELPHRRLGPKYDFLTDDLRASTGVNADGPVSSNGYDGFVLAMIEQYRDGLLLDCGAGRRPAYYSNVVNFEIADYDTTDVLGVNECLPFHDAVFDAVVSIAVLEHVRDPFASAAEICRVLKPGGRLICAVPFLQPEHGYPHHYYNMAPQGLVALFDSRLVVDDHKVLDSTGPTWVMHWIVQSWADGLDAATREDFLDLPLREFLRPPLALNGMAWARALPERKRFELASATVLFAHKRL